MYQNLKIIKKRSLLRLLNYLRGVTVTISTVFETVPMVENFDASLEELDDRLTEIIMTRV